MNKSNHTTSSIANEFEIIGRRVIAFIKKGDSISTTRLDKVLYENYLIDEFLLIEKHYTAVHIENMLKTICKPIEPLKGRLTLNWLFKERIVATLGKGEPKVKRPIDEDFVGLFKEILWLSHYLRMKHPVRLKLIGSNLDRLCRLTGIYNDPYFQPKSYNNDKNQYIENILSFKNKQIPFIPYPDLLDPGDLEKLMVMNDIDCPELLDIIRETVDMLYTPYERYHVLKWIKTIVHEKIQEKYDEHME